MARKERKIQRQKREETISKYMSIIQKMLLKGEDYIEWLSVGPPYDRACKLVAEREIHKLMKAKEVRQLGT